jgi:hypothetical protein
VLVAVAIAVVGGESRVRGSASYHRLGAGAARPQRPVALGRWRPTATGLLGLVVAAALVFPVVMVVHWMRRGAAPVRGRPTAGDVAVVVRPGQVSLGAPGEVPATVVHVRHLGHDALAGLRLDDGTTVDAPVGAIELPAVGSSVQVGLLGPVSAFPTG